MTAFTEGTQSAEEAGFLLALRRRKPWNDNGDGQRELSRLTLMAIVWPGSAIQGSV